MFSWPDSQDQLLNFKHFHFPSITRPFLHRNMANTWKWYTRNKSCLNKQWMKRFGPYQVACNNSLISYPCCWARTTRSSVSFISWHSNLKGQNLSLQANYLLAAPKESKLQKAKSEFQWSLKVTVRSKLYTWSKERMVNNPEFQKAWIVIGVTSMKIPEQSLRRWISSFVFCKKGRFGIYPLESQLLQHQISTA